ncbi:hypothetical protein IGI04_007171 [Brassica rapa subsp. trilocularis]|uniref:Uncharacterized protein n=1 Tax=Brassica rapa subsp. trilocularis TaxID=1813537 RepID=A0ABQ7NIY4_BRACM|nr:hypothetical protein IGI04_007171 [Brassica rapa subsp. trilocularis]
MRIHRIDEKKWKQGVPITSDLLSKTLSSLSKGASLQLSHQTPTKRSPARLESCRRHQPAVEAPPSTTARAAQVADRGYQAAGFSFLWSVTACTSKSQIRNRNCFLRCPRIRSTTN